MNPQPHGSSLDSLTTAPHGNSWGPIPELRSLEPLDSEGARGRESGETRVAAAVRLGTRALLRSVNRAAQVPFLSFVFLAFSFLKTFFGAAWLHSKVERKGQRLSRALCPAGLASPERRPSLPRHSHRFPSGSWGCCTGVGFRRSRRRVPPFAPRAEQVLTVLNPPRCAPGSRHLTPTPTPTPTPAAARRCAVPTVSPRSEGLEGGGFPGRWLLQLSFLLVCRAGWFVSCSHRVVFRCLDGPEFPCSAPAEGQLGGVQGVSP